MIFSDKRLIIVSAFCCINRGIIEALQVPEISGNIKKC